MGRVTLFVTCVSLDSRVVNVAKQLACCLLALPILQATVELVLHSACMLLVSVQMMAQSPECRHSELVVVLRPACAHPVIQTIRRLLLWFRPPLQLTVRSLHPTVPARCPC